MSSIAFFIYLVLLSFLITKIPFLKKSGLNNYWLLSLFILKVIAGLLYGYFYSSPANILTSDTWKFFRLSQPETELLLKNPIEFIKSFFTYGYNTSGNLFISHNSYWNNLKDNLLIKILAVINVFTFSNYYADVVWFNFFFFFGPVALYRLLNEKIVANKVVLIAFVFCIPSFLFWCSGLHKDGFIFLAITLCTFYFNEFIKQKKLLPKYALVIIFCVAILFAFRNFVVLLLLPALLTWYLCERYPKKKFLILSIIYGLAVIIFFAGTYINPSLNFPAYIVTKQKEFKSLVGNSQLVLPQLVPAVKSFMLFLPSAIDIAFLRPHITETANPLYWPSIAENIFIYVIIIYAIIQYYFNKKQFHLTSTAKAFFIFCFVFAVTNLLMMGYTVTLTGAIVRYKSFVLPFLIAPLATFVNVPARKAAY